MVWQAIRRTNYYSLGNWFTLGRDTLHHTVNLPRRAKIEMQGGLMVCGRRLYLNRLNGKYVSRFRFLKVSCDIANPPVNYWPIGHWSKPIRFQFLNQSETLLEFVYDS